MTEAEWLRCGKPRPMLHFLGAAASPRKLRLFGVACCRLAWQDLHEPRICELVLVAEQFADAAASLTQLRLAYRAGADAYAADQGDAGNQDVEESALGLGEALDLPPVTRWAAESSAHDDPDLRKRVRDPESDPESRNRAFALAIEARRSNGNASHAAVLRDIFGNPFRPITFSGWRTDTAVALARQMYDSRDFGAMPILADALQDAGCDNADVLSHCRDTNQNHVRGCWVVDLVLGKE